MIKRLGELLVGVRHRWRASLQLRVAATTLVLSLLVSGLVGVILLHQIRDGLLDAKAYGELTGTAS